MESGEFACLSGTELVSICRFYGGMEGCDGPARRAELVVKDWLMGMGVRGERRELQKRFEAGRRDAILKPVEGDGV